MDNTDDGLLDERIILASGSQYEKRQGYYLTHPGFSQPTTRWISSYLKKMQLIFYFPNLMPAFAWQGKGIN